jgi:transposase
VAEKNRLQVAHAAARPLIQKHIGWLEPERKQVDKDLGSAVRNSPMWRGKDDLLRSVPGVGPALAITPMAELPELGQLNRKQVATLWSGATRLRPGHPQGQAHGMGRSRCPLHGHALGRTL